MESPGWVPVVLSGAVPHGTSDALAMFTIGIASFDLWASPRQISLIPETMLVLTIAFVSVLASRSDTTGKLREELALIAYGGTGWQVWFRYFVRGLVCTLAATSLLTYVEYFQMELPLATVAALTLVASTVGGFFYAAPSLARVRSTKFAENYKG